MVCPVPRLFRVSQDKDKGIAHLTRVANVLEDGDPDGDGDGHGNRG